jgi:hypothetical protein
MANKIFDPNKANCKTLILHPKKDRMDRMDIKAIPYYTVKKG